MDAMVECEGCGEEYPAVACKHKCPSCGLAEGASATNNRFGSQTVLRFRDSD